MEILGIIATIFILIAFSRNNKIEIRLFDTIGAILFVIYGVCISSFSVALLNSILIILNVYKMLKEVTFNGKDD